MKKSYPTTQMIWATNTIQQLKSNQDLPLEFIEVVITEAIAEYVADTIDLAVLIEIVYAVKPSKVKLTPDLKSIVTDLMYLSRTHEPEVVNKTLIQALKKVNNKVNVSERTDPANLYFSNTPPHLYH